MPGLGKITANISAAVGRDCGLGKSFKFDFGAEGVVHVDAAVVPNIVSNTDLPADCTMRMNLSDYIGLFLGRIDIAEALANQRLIVLGDRTLARMVAATLPPPPDDDESVNR